MAEEIEHLNKIMVKSNKQYVLIGPGRWGSQDRFVGIPVNWSQISNAKLIVEVSLNNYPLDTSLGSHFFHNLTSMNIGYCSVQHNSYTDFIKWDQLRGQNVARQLLQAVVDFARAENKRIIPRCPFPIGENKSIIRVEIVLCFSANLNFSEGKTGVKCSKETRSRTTCGSCPLIFKTLTRGKNFSPSFGGRTTPFTVSPVFNPNKRTCEVDK